MTLRCRPGDLAVIVGGHRDDLQGSFVEVLSYDSTASYLMGDPAWQVRMLAGPVMDDLGRVAREAFTPDRYLDPIRPPKPEASVATFRCKPQRKGEGNEKKDIRRRLEKAS